MMIQTKGSQSYAGKAAMYADYILEHRSTIRGTAKHFGASRSTVYKYLTKYIPKGYQNDLKELFAYNLSQRSSRGGQALAEKRRMTS